MQKLIMKQKQGSEQQVFVEEMRHFDDVYRVVDEFGNPSISTVEVELVEYGNHVVNSLLYADCYWLREGRVIPVMMLADEESLSEVVALESL